VSYRLLLRKRIAEKRGDEVQVKSESPPLKERKKVSEKKSMGKIKGHRWGNSGSGKPENAAESRRELLQEEGQSAFWRQGKRRSISGKNETNRRGESRK